MANTKEIRQKIASIQSTQKITRAMEMVAASKMRRSQQRVIATRPYLERIEEVIQHVIQGNLEYTHTYLRPRPVKNAMFLVLSTDRGLCGALNINLFKGMIAKMHELSEQGIGVQVCTVGKKAENFFLHHGANVVASISNIGDAPKMTDLIGIMKIVIDNFLAESVDEVYLGFNKFISTLSQQAKIERLLPIQATYDKPTHDYTWDYIYEPDAASLLDVLLQRFIETLIYQGTVENVACEQAARMLAMKNASDNAEELIEDLKLVYNKARQAAITKELAEIVAGAAAV